MTTATQTQSKNLFTQAELTGSPTQSFDLANAAGPMQGPTEHKVDDKSLVSNQLTSLLSSGSPYIQLARTQAAQQANSRGLLNTSMAAGAGQVAAIDRALPIAQADAGEFSKSGFFNAENKNLFARDQNNFMREGALNKMNNLGQMERLGAELSWRNTDREDTQAYGTSEREAAQRYNTGEREATQEFTLERDNNTLNNELKRLGFADQLDLARLPINYAISVQTNTQNQINQILADPSLSPEAKRGAIQNLVTYNNTAMAWAEQFFGVNNMTRMSAPTMPGQTAAAAPAPAPAPAPAWWDNYIGGA